MSVLRTNGPLVSVPRTFSKLMKLCAGTSEFARMKSKGKKKENALQMLGFVRNTIRKHIFGTVNNTMVLM